ncbi:MAG: ComF family protein [Bacteroidetes bacterium]|nr:ComF family protein [Bacteroidota bacterium]
MRAIIQAILDILYPPLCLGCERRIHVRDVLCAHCLLELHPYPQSSAQSLQHLASLHHVCDALMMSVGYEYEDDGVLEHCIRAMKYRQLHAVGEWLGRLLGERLLQTPILEGNPVLVPVPLHRVKRMERGYNQAAYLARGVASECGLELQEHLLRRVRYTTSLSASKMKQDERKEHIRAAFAVDPVRIRIVAGRPILLVDDLITTGATMGECVRVLNDAGFPEVRLLALARPPRH